MKTKVIVILSVVIVAVIAVYYSCSNKEKEDDNGEISVVANKPQPLNLSIYLDLSDRINPSTNDSKALSQKDKDIAIIEYLANYVKNRAVKQKILDIVRKSK